MNCMLCKGKGYFLIKLRKNKNENIKNIFGEDFELYDIIKKKCPRCHGEKQEKYIPIGKNRYRQLTLSYCNNYSIYFDSLLSADENLLNKILMQ